MAVPLIGSTEREYVDALLTDLGEELESVRGREIVSIFFGGGTPSLVSSRAIGAVIDHTAAHGSLVADAEITLEANPGATDRGRFRGYREAGVNRLSIGAQSFNNRLLRQIGRIHDARGARAAVDDARAAGFDNINIDVMFALPGQSRADGAADVEAVIQLAPEHVSYYQLTLEPNTAFYEKPPELPEEEDGIAMHEYALQRLRETGWFRYEVSAFARSGRECAHNRNYWEFGDYLGVGAGAHGKVTREGVVARYGKPRHPKAYMAVGAAFRTNEHTLSDQSLLFEFMLNALRLPEGVPLRIFEERTGLSLETLEQKLAPFIENRLIRWAGGRVRATDRGYPYLNDILERLLPEEDANSALSATAP